MLLRTLTQPLDSQCLIKDCISQRKRWLFSVLKVTFYNAEGCLLRFIREEVSYLYIFLYQACCK